MWPRPLAVVWHDLLGPVNAIDVYFHRFSKAAVI